MDFLLGLILLLIKIAVMLGGLLLAASYLVWLERKLLARLQVRLGPNRAGIFGMLQPIADAVKLLCKEDIVPAAADGFIFRLAPAVVAVTAMLMFAVVPLGPDIRVFGRAVPMVIVDLNVGLLYVFALSSLGVYGVALGGWASNSKFALLGGIRGAAQMISYELALALSLMGVVLQCGTLRPMEIVEKQAGWFWEWNAFAGGWQILGFVIFLVAGFAETNRLPFDLPEAEAELVAGYHTEYSSMKFAMFFMAEYVNMITSSALAVTLFLGGWQLGIPAEVLGLPAGWPLWLLQIGAFVAKVAFFQFVFVWVRWTLPRFRYDQLMNVGWKGLLPLALVNLVFTALLAMTGRGRW
jgi:NADH-quinone oxidoreductase subunit H